MSDLDYVAHNKTAWNTQVDNGNPWTIGVTSEQIAEARQGQLKIYLTPTKTVPTDWFPQLTDCDVLCLASGGGQQAPLLAASGARVTVVDNSPKQLATDRQVADREGLKLTTIEADAADLSMLQDSSLDLVVHPVSNCFIADIQAVWREVARILRPGGRLMTGITNPALYLFDDIAMQDNQLKVTHTLPYKPDNPDVQDETKIHLEKGEPLEFSHSLEEQIGGQTQVGLAIISLFEDTNRPDNKYLVDAYLPIYIATLAVKLSCFLSKSVTN